MVRRHVGVGSGDGGQGDGVAEGFELADVGVGASLRVGALADVVRAEVAVAGVRIAE